MKHLLSYFKPYIKESILAPLFKLLEAVFELLVPMVIAGIVDQILAPEKSRSSLDADWSAPYLCSDWSCSGLGSSVLLSQGSGRIC